MLTATEPLIHCLHASRRRGGFVNLEWFWIERYRTVAQVAGGMNLPATPLQSRTLFRKSGNESHKRYCSF